MIFYLNFFILSRTLVSFIALFNLKDLALFTTAIMNTRNNLYQMQQSEQMRFSGLPAPSPLTLQSNAMAADCSTASTLSMNLATSSKAGAATKLSATMSFADFAAAHCASIPPPIPMQWQLTIDEEHAQIALNEDDELAILDVSDIESHEIDADEDDVDDSFDIPSMSLLQTSNSSTSSSISSVSVLSFESDQDADDEVLASPARTTATPQWLFETDAFRNSEVCHVQLELHRARSTDGDDQHSELQAAHKHNVEAACQAADECEQYEPLECADIVRTLQQFGHSNTAAYQQHASVLLHGYIRGVQEEVKHIIPSEIATICCDFYYETEKVHIGLAFNLYQQLAVEQDSDSRVALLSMQRGHDTFSGQQLKRILAEQHDEETEHVEQDAQSMRILRECVQCHIVDLVSYRTSFSSLFNNVQSEPQSFVPSQHYIYCFNPQFQVAFAEYDELLRQ